MYISLGLFLELHSPHGTPGKTSLGKQVWGLHECDTVRPATVLPNHWRNKKTSVSQSMSVGN